MPRTRKICTCPSLTLGLQGGSFSSRNTSLPYIQPPRTLYGKASSKSKYLYGLFFTQAWSSPKYSKFLILSYYIRISIDKLPLDLLYLWKYWDACFLSRCQILRSPYNICLFCSSIRGSCPLRKEVPEGEKAYHRFLFPFSLNFFPTQGKRRNVLWRAPTHCDTVVNFHSG